MSSLLFAATRSRLEFPLQREGEGLLFNPASQTMAQGNCKLSILPTRIN